MTTIITAGGFPFDSGSPTIGNTLYFDGTKWSKSTGLSLDAATTLKVLLADGSVATPSLSFAAQTGTGISRDTAANEMVFSVNGIEAGRLKAPAGANPQLVLPVGSASKPSLWFGSSGFYSLSSEVVFVYGSTGRWGLGSNTFRAQGTGESYIQSMAVSGNLSIGGRQDQTTSANPSIRFAQYASLPFIGASIDQKMVSIEAAVNQTGTSSFTALNIDVTETAVGSGNQRLIDSKVGGSSKFSVGNTGIIRSGLDDSTLANYRGTHATAGVGVESTGVVRIYSNTGEALRCASGYSYFSSSIVPTNALRDIGYTTFSFRDAYLQRVLTGANTTPVGTAAAPDVVAKGDTTTGLFWPSAGKVGISTGGVQLGMLKQALTAATGDETTVDLTATVNKAGGNYTGLKLNVTEAAAPGIDNRLIDLQVGGTSKFSVSNNGSITLNGTVDGRDITADGAKLDGIEAGADVTDAANVAAAGAVMADGSVAMTGDLNLGTHNITNGQFTGTIADGTAAAPGLRFTSQTNTGILRPGTSGVGISLGGTLMWQFTGTKLIGQNATTGIGAQTASVGTFAVNGSITNDLTNPGLRLYNFFSLNATGAGQQTAVRIDAALNQVGSSSGASVLAVDATNTSLGSGSQYLADFRIGGTTVTAIRNSTTATAKGQLLSASGDAATPGLSFLAASNAGIYYASGLHLAVGGVSQLSVDGSGNVTVAGTIDGRDVATDGAKLDTIEAGADVTDYGNVKASGALMADGSVTLTQDLPVASGKGLAGAGTLALKATGASILLQISGVYKLVLGMTEALMYTTLRPDTTLARDLGTATYRFLNAYIGSVKAGSVSIDTEDNGYPSEEKTYAKSTPAGSTTTLVDVSLTIGKGTLIIVDAFMVGSDPSKFAISRSIIGASNAATTPTILPALTTGTKIFEHRSAAIVKSEVRFATGSNKVSVNLYNDVGDPALTWYVRIKTLSAVA